MKSRFICFLVGCLPGFCFAEPEKSPDLSTPTAAIRAFYSAIAEGDAAAAEAAAIAGEAELAWLKAQADLNAALARLGKNGAERFPEDGQTLKQTLPADAALQKTLEIVERDRIVPAGDSFLVPVNPRFPFRVKRQGDVWNVDLIASFSAPTKVGGPALAEQAELFRKIAGYVDDVASGIAAGRYASVDDVRADLRRRRAALEAQP